MAAAPEPVGTNFVADIIDEEIKSGKHEHGKIVTRFPPEPNGYLHLGHAKSICLNFGLGRKYAGRTHLRFDDTNPTKEETEYVESIMEDVKWLGGDWGDRLHYASDYFDTYYEWALHMIKNGDAYVDSQTLTEIRENRGSVSEPGKNSPYRERSVDENLALFEKMKNGEFPDGHCVLRAKIDMASPNMNMRDPVVYRIQKAHHHRTGDKWCIYPMYDYAHGQGDAIEGITHSVCTLEFELHRPLYEWFLDHLPVPCKPRQIEFARLNLTYTLMSKRKLLELVQEKVVRGWDDPRMPP
jgi:glutaminyl-tRNA synthetase